MSGEPFTPFKNVHEDLLSADAIPVLLDAMVQIQQGKIPPQQLETQLSSIRLRLNRSKTALQQNLDLVKKLDSDGLSKEQEVLAAELERKKTAFARLKEQICGKWPDAAVPGGDEPEHQPKGEPVDQSIEQPEAEPVVQPTDQPEAEPVVQSIDQPQAESTDQPQVQESTQPEPHLEPPTQPQPDEMEIDG